MCSASIVLLVSTGLAVTPPSTLSQPASAGAVASIATRKLAAFFMGQESHAGAPRASPWRGPTRESRRAHEQFPASLQIVVAAAAAEAVAWRRQAWLSARCRDADRAVPGRGEAAHLHRRHFGRRQPRGANR